MTYTMTRTISPFDIPAVMTKDEILQARVSKRVKRQVDEIAQQKNKKTSEYVRSVIKANLTDDSASVNIPKLFEDDLRSIARDTGERTGVYEAIEAQVWETIADDAFRQEVRRPVFDADGTVTIAGQGSSTSVGYWLADRLRDRGIRSQVRSGVEATGMHSSADDTILAISRSGKTDSILDLCSNQPATVVAVTDPDSPLAERADHVVPLPSVEERIDIYATKSLVAQLAVLQVVFLDDYVDLQRFQARFRALDEFVEGQFKQGDDAAGLSGQSDILAAIEELQRHNDLQSDPIFGALGSQRGLGNEAQLKLTEFLHVHAEATNLQNIVHRLVNVLHGGSSYLVTAIPQQGSATYREWNDVLFGDETSVWNVLQSADFDQKVPLIAFTLNGGPAEQAVRERSLYGRDGLVRLDAYAVEPEARDLILFVAIQLFAYGALCKLWLQDPALQSRVIQSIYNPAETSDTEVN